MIPGMQLRQPLPMPPFARPPDPLAFQVMQPGGAFDPRSAAILQHALRQAAPGSAPVEPETEGFAPDPLALAAAGGLGTQLKDKVGFESDFTRGLDRLRAGPEARAEASRSMTPENAPDPAVAAAIEAESQNRASAISQERGKPGPLAALQTDPTALPFPGGLADPERVVQAESEIARGVAQDQQVPALEQVAERRLPAGSRTVAGMEDERSIQGSTRDPSVLAAAEQPVDAFGGGRAAPPGPPTDGNLFNQPLAPTQGLSPELGLRAPSAGQMQVEKLAVDPATNAPVITPGGTGSSPLAPGPPGPPRYGSLGSEPSPIDLPAVPAAQLLENRSEGWEHPAISRAEAQSFGEAANPTITNVRPNVETPSATPAPPRYGDEVFTPDPNALQGYRKGEGPRGGGRAEGGRHPSRGRRAVEGNPSASMPRDFLGHMRADAASQGTPSGVDDMRFDVLSGYDKSKVARLHYLWRQARDLVHNAPDLHDERTTAADVARHDDASRQLPGLAAALRMAKKSQRKSDNWAGWNVEGGVEAANAAESLRRDPDFAGAVATVRKQGQRLSEGAMEHYGHLLNDPSFPFAIRPRDLGRNPELIEDLARKLWNGGFQYEKGKWTEKTREIGSFEETLANIYLDDIEEIQASEKGARKPDRTNAATVEWMTERAREQADRSGRSWESVLERREKRKAEEAAARAGGAEAPAADADGPEDAGESEYERRMREFRAESAEDEANANPYDETHADPVGRQSVAEAEVSQAPAEAGISIGGPEPDIDETPASVLADEARRAAAATGDEGPRLAARALTSERKPGSPGAALQEKLLRRHRLPGADDPELLADIEWLGGELAGMDPRRAAGDKEVNNRYFRLLGRMNRELPAEIETALATLDTAFKSVDPAAVDTAAQALNGLLRQQYLLLEAFKNEPHPAGRQRLREGSARRRETTRKSKERQRGRAMVESGDIEGGQEVLGNVYDPSRSDPKSREIGITENVRAGMGPETREPARNLGAVVEGSAGRARRNLQQVSRVLADARKSFKHDSQTIRHLEAQVRALEGKIANIESLPKYEAPLAERAGDAARPKRADSSPGKPVRVPRKDAAGNPLQPGKDPKGTALKLAKEAHARRTESVEAQLERGSGRGVQASRAGEVPERGNPNATVPTGRRLKKDPETAKKFPQYQDPDDLVKTEFRPGSAMGKPTSLYDSTEVLEKPTKTVIDPKTGESKEVLKVKRVGWKADEIGELSPTGGSDPAGKLSTGQGVTPLSTQSWEPGPRNMLRVLRDRGLSDAAYAHATANRGQFEELHRKWSGLKDEARRGDYFQKVSKFLEGEVAGGKQSLPSVLRGKLGDKDARGFVTFLKEHDLQGIVQAIEQRSGLKLDLDNPEAMSAKQYEAANRQLTRAIGIFNRAGLLDASAVKDIESGKTSRGEILHVVANAARKRGISIPEAIRPRSTAGSGIVRKGERGDIFKTAASIARRAI